jgi:2-keto-3-deoxy-L-arabinonate dehydratase
MKALEGIFPILCTTFKDDGSLDPVSQARLVEHLLASGAHGIGMFGIASEGYSLTENERRSILKSVRKQVAGRAPLVVSSGHTGTDAAVALSKEAEDMGADALMILPPYFLKTDGDGLVHYYEAVGKAVEVPIMIQDAPLLTQVAMPPALLGRIAQQVERVKYVKVEAPPTASKVTAVIDAGGPTVFGGMNGLFLIEEIGRGSQGTMPGSDMIGIFVEIWNHMQAGDRAAAYDVFTRALPLIRFELQPGMGVSAMKHDLMADGVIASARVRHPTTALDAQSLKELAWLRERLRERAHS